MNHQVTCGKECRRARRNRLAWWRRRRALERYRSAERARQAVCRARSEPDSVEDRGGGVEGDRDGREPTFGEGADEPAEGLADPVGRNEDSADSASCHVPASVWNFSNLLNNIDEIWQGLDEVSRAGLKAGFAGLERVSGGSTGRSGRRNGQMSRTGHISRVGPP